MIVELIPLLAAGVAGGLAMLAAQIAASAAGAGRAVDLTGLWSALLGLRERGTPVAGFLLHLLVSVGVAAGYAMGFRVAGVMDMGWAWGLVGGVIHWVAAGTFLAVAAGDGGAVAAELPGPFARRLGPGGAVAFLVAHLLFGLVAGVVYFALHSAGGVQAAL
jgi:hypothetical protein